MSENLTIGQQVPELKADAVMPDGTFDSVSLSDHHGKYVVLLFYPLDFTFVCPTELRAFSERHADFVAQGAEVLGVSVDSKFSHLAWINAPLQDGGLGSLQYPLVSDIRKEMSQTFGVLDAAEGVALRGLFIIDPDGVLQYSSISAMNIGRSVDEALRVLAALKHTRENPHEVCPANWSTGQDTIRPADEIAGKQRGSTKAVAG